MPKYVDGAGLSRFWNNIRGSIGSASQEQVDAWLTAHPEATTTVQDGSITDAKLVQSGGVLSEVHDVRVGLNEVAYDNAGDAVREQVSAVSQGYVQISSKSMNWQNGYIDYNGVIRASSLSQFALVKLNKGEKVIAGTRNTTITIIGSTTAESLSVGDSVTPIKRTSSTDIFETYEYTATYDMNIVVCVRASNYILKFFEENELYRKVEDDLNTSMLMSLERNVLKFGSKTVTTNGITFTSNGTTVIANGTATENASYIHIKFTPLLSGKYKLSGCPSGGALNQYYISIDGISGKIDYGSGVTVDLTKGIEYTLRFVVFSGRTVSNLTFTPAIVCAEYFDEPENDLKIRFIGLSNNTTYKYGPSGQAQVVQFPNGKNMLIDSHNLPNYIDFSSRLVAMGVTHFDYIMISHYHSDHVGLINVMTQSVTAGRLDISGATVFLPPEITEENLASITDDPSTLVARQATLATIFEQQGCTIVRPTEGQTVDVGDVQIEFWNTDHSDYADASGSYYSHNYNDWSLCCTMTFGNTRIAFTADIGPTGERKVGGTLYPVDIMTAPHHGWDNGANNLIPVFINNLSPKMVISTNGWEHHPENISSPANMLFATSAMQSWCERNGVPIYPTCMNGMIDLVVNKYGYHLDGKYTRYIRNGKNWKYVDNSTEYAE